MRNLTYWRLRHRWQRWRQMPWPERRLFFQALFLLPIMALALRIFEFKRVYAFVSRPLPRPLNINHTQQLEYAQTTARLVQAAAHLLPFSATCLPRSLTLWSLLHRQGIVSNLKIGVQKVESEFAAHAWVEYDGVALNENADVGERFVAFDGITQPNEN